METPISRLPDDPSFAFRLGEDSSLLLCLYLEEGMSESLALASGFLAVTPVLLLEWSQEVKKNGKKRRQNSWRMKGAHLLCGQGSPEKEDCLD